MIKEGGIERLSLFLEDQSKYQTPKTMLLSQPAHTHKIPRSKRGNSLKGKWESEVKIRKTFSNNFSKIIQAAFIEPLLWASSWTGCSGDTQMRQMGPRWNSVGKKDETQMRAMLSTGQLMIHKVVSNRARQMGNDHGHRECKLPAERNMSELSLGGQEL